MLEKIHQIERGAPMPHFVTLTFPDLFPTQAEAKRKLDNLFKRWKRKWPKTSAIWRMELKDRKSGKSAGQVAPHFHLLVWGHFDKETAAKDWFEVNGESQYAHLKHGTDAEQLESWKGAVHYCAKYVAKSDDDFQSEGRIWGAHNKAALPVDEPVKVPLSPRQAFAFKRLVRRYVRAATGKRISPHSIFTCDPQKWWDAACNENSNPRTGHRRDRNVGNMLRRFERSAG